MDLLEKTQDDILSNVEELADFYNELDDNVKEDGHAPIGYGFVPLQQLINVGLWAIQNNISMVYE